MASPHLIGLSVSGCISDILSGLVQLGEVALIIGGTKCATDEQWADLELRYRESAWFKNPDRGVTLLRWFRAQGMIIQPRVLGFKLPPGYMGHWARIGHLVLQPREVGAISRVVKFQPYN